MTKTTATVISTTPAVYTALEKRTDDVSPSEVAASQELDESTRANRPMASDQLVANPAPLLYQPSERQTREQAVAAWVAQYTREVLPDAMGVAWSQVRLDRRDGAMFRPGRKGLPVTRHALGQLFGLLGSARGVSTAAQHVPPYTRASLLLDAVAGCDRSATDPSDTLVVRTYAQRELTSPTGQVLRPAREAVVRAVLSARHAGTYYDDPVLARLVTRHTPANAPVYVRRAEGGVETRGWALTRERAGLQLGVSFRSSETGQARLSFRAVASIRCVDAVLTAARSVGIAEGESVQVARAVSSSERNHTLPTVSTEPLREAYGVNTYPGGKLTPSERQSIADQRLDDSWRVALADAEALADQWEDALAAFPTGGALTDADAESVAVLLDLMEEHGLAPAAEDREAFEKLLANETRLSQLPRLSAAHIAAAYAVLASSAASEFLRDEKGEVVKKDGKPETKLVPRSWDDAARLQATAGRWVAAGWDLAAHRKLGHEEE